MSKSDTCETEIQEAYKQLIVYAEDLHTTINLLKESHFDLEMAYLDSVNRLAQAVEYKDEATGNHVSRICFFSAILADAAGLPCEHVMRIYNSAAMHDVGKISIPDAILLKPGPLTAAEFETMKSHTTVGAKLLANSKSDLLETGRIIALTHHEKWNGTGYPKNLAGTNIPIEGRTVALADVYDALRSERSYKPAFSWKNTAAILTEEAGHHFDPHLVELFFANADKIQHVDSILRSKGKQDINALLGEVLPICDVSACTSVTSIL
ncbi:HD-GYP domain-containing protein [Halodesulfovibrio spirochaetisodalis]|uniref:HD-GYP domain-containing protein n=1 Tax=Halodesulfovibrio spirochaetisodalis TaxID=1560234 RepID=UPI00082E6B5C|nr:HD domain-containing phosphohydrolase [Halodesulfovibrio spirochaetisodalis]